MLTPGIYCGGIDIKPNATVWFQPGVYVIKGGRLNVQAQSSVAGAGVAFYFTGAGAQFKVHGGGAVDLKAPAAGSELAGFVLAQDRTADPGTSTVIQGGGRIKLEGILYMPTWQVNISGNGEVNQESKYFAMIADSFYMEGNGKLYIKSDAAGANLPHLMPKIPTGPLLLQ